MPARPAIAVRCTMALVEPPIASSTRSAFSTDFSVMISLGRIGDAAICTARRPLSSAARSRSACTAGIAAVPGSAMPSASAIDAMVEAVPITAQVPAVVARLPSMVFYFCGIDLARAMHRPEAPAVGAGAEALAAERGRHHRPGEELHRRHVGRGRAHELRRHGLVAAADQHHRVHRLRADHLLDVDRHQVAEHHRGRDAGTLRPATRWGTRSAGRRRRARRASPPRSARGSGGGSC